MKWWHENTEENCKAEVVTNELVWVLLCKAVSICFFVSSRLDPLKKKSIFESLKSKFLRFLCWSNKTSGAIIHMLWSWSFEIPTQPPGCGNCLLPFLSLHLQVTLTFNVIYHQKMVFLIIKPEIIRFLISKVLETPFLKLPFG